MSAFEWKRAVIKVGSALIAPSGSQCSATYLLPIAQFISASHALGKEVIIVSSGSVAAGRDQIPVHHRATIAEKQAMAAIGQTQMMANWQRFFDRPCAQIMLTYDDLRDRTRYVNIKNTLGELLKHNAIPIVNENDTVAVNELQVGDNDNLAAYTALVAQADTLIICSDIDGLYTADPRKDPSAQLIPKVNKIDEALFAIAGGAGSAVGTGGMFTKLQAAQKCMQSGIQTLIVNGKKADIFDALRQGQSPGTLFIPDQSANKARQLWLTHTLTSCGAISIDSGAYHALSSKGASLLPSGILKVSGHFNVGDAVDITHDNNVIGKGLALLNNDDLQRIKGLQGEQAASVLGYAFGPEVVHRDDMVILK
ncbi:glutamate 5-kinase [Alteromonas sediminis]|uniref:Glutamate 5-kinase n=1 Tax=Alteromonas sediminis TaxID=2259342 RepID=A0A3N5Y0S7_9ALTE|nr:glutamate 5-kinase [Alteromonas sediminis]RPJ66730.1 glutamate 5-kinase [Alteromonas sediminis]